MNPIVTACTAALLGALALAAPAAALEPAPLNGAEPPGSKGQAADATPAAPLAEKPPASPFHLDLETDPTAFIFSGYSLHAGLGYRRLRLDLGVYAMDVPGFAEPDDGFESSFRGVGAKLQFFLFHEQKGGFVGIDGGANQLHVKDADTAATASQLQVSLGVNLGWRFALPLGFYATPWLGVSYSFNARELAVGSRSYEPTVVTFFPAVHLGYRFL